MLAILLAEGNMAEEFGASVAEKWAARRADSPSCRAVVGRRRGLDHSHALVHKVGTVDGIAVHAYLDRQCGFLDFSPVSFYPTLVSLMRNPESATESPVAIPTKTRISHKPRSSGDMLNGNARTRRRSRSVVSHLRLHLASCAHDRDTVRCQL